MCLLGRVVGILLALFHFCLEATDLGGQLLDFNLRKCMLFERFALFSISTVVIANEVYPAIIGINTEGSPPSENTCNIGGEERSTSKDRFKIGTLAMSK